MADRPGPITARPDGTLRPVPRPDLIADAAPEPGRLRPQARPEGLGEGPAQVAEAATEAVALPLGRTALIGLLSGPSGRAALVRLGTGDVIRAAAGDVVGDGVVTAIAEGALHLWRDGAEEILTMPA